MAVLDRYLLDTNMFSYIATGRSQAARARLSTLETGRVACLSSISEAEIRFGLAKEAGRRWHHGVEALLASLQVLAWGREEAAVYGESRKELQVTGKPLANMDMLIAAHALALRAILVTNDKAFGRVPNLMLENWATDF